MPRKYVKLGITPSNKNLAIQNVKSRNMSIHAASKTFAIRRDT